jgi:5'-3' exonuclease
MYQLLDEHTKIYNLHKKNYVTVPDVISEFRIQPKNFALAKALCGDATDNISGIKGMGFKTAAKILPFLSLEDDIILDDLFKYCDSHSDESTYLKRIVEQKDLIQRNWRLVYLDGGMLSAHQASKIDSLIDTFDPQSNRMGLIKALIKEGINDFDVADFLMVFNCIENVRNG